MLVVRFICFGFHWFALFMGAVLVSIQLCVAHCLVVFACALNGFACWHSVHCVHIVLDEFTCVACWSVVALCCFCGWRIVCLRMGSRYRVVFACFARMHLCHVRSFSFLLVCCFLAFCFRNPDFMGMCCTSSSAWCWLRGEGFQLTTGRCMCVCMYVYRRLGGATVRASTLWYVVLVTWTIMRIFSCSKLEPN